MGRKVRIFMPIDMAQKEVKTTIYAPYQFRQDFDDFIHRYEDGGSGCGSSVDYLFED